MSYKIVCSDLDGTLLNNDSQVSRENLQAIETLIQKGVLFVPASGRSFLQIPEEIRNNPAIRYIICSNGGVFYDRHSNQRQVMGMSSQVLKDIFEIFKEYEALVTIDYNGYTYADMAYNNESSLEYYHIVKEQRMIFRTLIVWKEDFFNFCSQIEEGEMFSVFFHDYDAAMECKSKLERLGGLRVTGTAERNLEIINEKVGKGNALRGIAESNSIAKEDIISIGDSWNDISSLEAAGLGLAVSNACDSLKEVADEIICSNEEHIVPYILSHYFE